MKHFTTSHHGVLWVCTGNWEGKEITFHAETEEKVRKDAYNGLMTMGYIEMEDNKDRLLKIVMDKMYKIKVCRNEKKA
jgi:hypothetical protein